MDHTICHFEIPAEEPKRAAEFYRGLFDWDIHGVGQRRTTRRRSMMI